MAERQVIPAPAQDGPKEKGHSRNDQPPCCRQRWIPEFPPQWTGQDLALPLPRCRCGRHRGRPPAGPERAGGRHGHAQNAGDRPGGPRRGRGVLEAPVPHHRDHRGAVGHPHLLHRHQGGEAGRGHRPELRPGRPLPRYLLPLRGRLLRVDRLHRHEHRRAGQRPHGGRGLPDLLKQSVGGRCFS